MEQKPIRALIVIDVQLDYFSGPITVTYRGPSPAPVSCLLRTCRTA